MKNWRIEEVVGLVPALREGLHCGTWQVYIQLCYRIIREQVLDLVLTATSVLSLCILYLKAGQEKRRAWLLKCMWDLKT